MFSTTHSFMHFPGSVTDQAAKGTITISNASNALDQNVIFQVYSYCFINKIIGFSSRK